MKSNTSTLRNDRLCSVMQDSDHGLDVLMITYNRPEYTHLALKRLLSTCDDSMRVWLWHNGNHAATLEVVRGFVDHPRVHRFHHSVENLRLREPTNWMLQGSRGEFVSKVDDDCLVPEGWFQTIRTAHEANANLGVVGCWRFQPEDFIPEVAEKKIVELNGGHRLLVNCWVEGSGYVMKRQCVAQAGVIRERESFPGYCIRLARMGWLHGWYFPFLYQEHMDDPRTEHTLLKSDADLEKYTPLTAQTFGAATLAQWTLLQQQLAKGVQEAPANPKAYSWWRMLLRRKVYSRVARLCGFAGPCW